MATTRDGETVRDVSPTLGRVAVIRGTVMSGPVHCGECGGEIPAGDEAYTLIALETLESTINCGSCYMDED